MNDELCHTSLLNGATELACNIFSMSASHSEGGIEAACHDSKGINACASSQAVIRT
jgi:hypothetical protein